MHLTKLEPCFDCYRKFSCEQMDFDHVRGVKKYNLSVAYRKASSIADLQRELAKCDLICANCHRDRTQARLGHVRLDANSIVVPDAVAPTVQPGLSLSMAWYQSNRARTFALLKRHRLRTSDFIRSLKDGKPCADCGEPHPYWRLDFDHREDKSINISLISSKKHWGEKRILQEIAKCDLVCANCHRLRTVSKGQHLSSSSFEESVRASA